MAIPASISGRNTSARRRLSGGGGPFDMRTSVDIARHKTSEQRRFLRYAETVVRDQRAGQSLRFKAVGGNFSRGALIVKDALKKIQILWGEWCIRIIGKSMEHCPAPPMRAEADDLPVAGARVSSQRYQHSTPGKRQHQYRN